jgi:uncharacterized BrkB/YihY/UPF0761 family membrane protein
VLPLYVRLEKHNPVLQTLSGPAVLLVWLYVMANMIVLGAEVNWWQGRRALPSDARAPEPSRLVETREPGSASLNQVR